MFLWQREFSCTKLTGRLWFRKRFSPCRSSGDASGKAVPKRTCLLCKLRERRNEGAPTPELRSGRIDGGYAPNSQKKLSKLNEKFCIVLKLPL